MNNYTTTSRMSVSNDEICEFSEFDGNYRLLKIPRSKIAEVAINFDFGGNYFLIGNQNYTGETGNLGGRLMTHIKDPKKSYFNYAIIFTKGDTGIDATSRKYVEYSWVEKSKKCRKYIWENISHPECPQIHEHERMKLDRTLKSTEGILGLICDGIFDDTKNLPVVKSEENEKILIDENDDFSICEDVSQENEEVKRENREGVAYIYGEPYNYRNATEGTTIILTKLFEDHLTLFEELSKHPVSLKTKNTYISQYPDDTCVDTPHLNNRVKTLPNRWYLGSVLNTFDKVKIIQSASEICGKTYMWGEENKNNKDIIFNPPIDKRNKNKIHEI